MVMQRNYISLYNSEGENYVPPGGGGPSGSGPSIGMSWSAVSGATGYKVLWGMSTREYTSTVDIGNVTSYTLADSFAEGDTVYWAIRAYNANGDGMLSKERSTIIPHWSRVFYVAPAGSGGSDSNPGTIGAPWLTFAKARTTATTAGDTVFFRGGTYAVTAQQIMAQVGSAGNKIVFRNYPGEVPVFSVSGIGAFEGIVRVDSNTRYFRLEGFEIPSSGYYGLLIFNNAHHCDFVSNNIHNTTESAIWVERSSPANKAFNRFENNIAKACGNGGITIWKDGTNSTNAGGYNLFQGNEVDGCATGATNFDGMQVGGGSSDSATHHCAIVDNDIHDSGNDNAGPDPLDLGGHFFNSHYLVEGNRLYNNSGNNFKCHSGDGFIGTPTYTAGSSSHHLVRFNEFTAMRFHQYGFPNPIAMYQNTWYNSPELWNLYCGDYSGKALTNGDSTYATWLAARGISDTDTGRQVTKNDLYFMPGSSSVAAISVNSIGSNTFSYTYASTRKRGNEYKFTSGQTILWNGVSYGAFSQFATYQGSNNPNFPDTNSNASATATAASAYFVDVATRQYQPVSGSPANGVGIQHSMALAAGSSSTTLIADRASMFCDGYKSGSERVTRADWIKIGSGAPVQIDSIAEGTDPSVFNVITLQAARDWSAGDAIWLVEPETMTIMDDMGAIPWRGYQQLPRVTGVALTSLAP